MKRVNHLFDYLISDENLGNAIDEVNATHRWRPRHRPDKTVQRVEADRAGSIEALRTIIVSGFEPAPARRKLARGTRIPVSLAFGLLSRLGQLKHCSSVHLYRRLVRKGTQKMMKQVVREYMRKERRRWNISLAQTA